MRSSKMWLVAFMILALALFIGPMAEEVYAQKETGEVSEGDVSELSVKVGIKDSGNCVFKKTQFVTGNDGTNITSETFVDVPAAVVTFA